MRLAENAASVTTWWQVVLLIIGAIGGVGGLVALLTINQTRRKIGSEADSNMVNSGVVVSQAAINQMNAAIQQSQRDATKALEYATKNDLLEKRVDELEGEHRSWRRAAEEHKIWDQEMVAEVTRLGGTPKNPPPLYPLQA